MISAQSLPVNADLVNEAYGYLNTVLPTSPCEFSSAISDLLGREVWLKWELMMPTRSFKVRGALFKTRTLTHDGRGNVKGLATASSGNHGLGLAYAARVHGYSATVFVPVGANESKVRAIRSLGATVTSIGLEWQESYEHAKSMCADTGFAYVHSYDDPAIIAGQASIGVEIAAQVPAPDVVIVPVSGGGLISGVAMGMAMHSPTTKVIGVQTAVGDAMRQSLEAGHRVMIPRFRTIADGLGSRRPGAYTFEIASQLVDRVVTVREPTIREAMAIILREERLLAEPSAAVSVAALIESSESIPGGRTVCVISGGNVDPSLLPGLAADAAAQSTGGGDPGNA
jgi:threonine dehydratase